MNDTRDAINAGKAAERRMHDHCGSVIIRLVCAKSYKSIVDAILFAQASDDWFFASEHDVACIKKIFTEAAERLSKGGAV